MDTLTVKLVEEIQQAAERKVPVDEFVSQFKSATLPALLEYGCLRWTMNSSVPALPSAVMNSATGKALLEVRSELGLRTTGRPKTPARRIDVRPVEYHVLDPATASEDSEWEQYEIRFDRSAQSAGLPLQTAHALQGAFHEMAENAVIHADAPTAILLGYQAVNGAALFSVADVGVGVLASLHSHRAYRHIELHNDAIRAALHDGTSRFGPNTRGLGFKQVFKALAAQWGHLRFRSGLGCITLNGESLDADQGEVTFPPFLPGFQVTVCCRATPPPVEGRSI